MITCTFVGAPEGCAVELGWRPWWSGEGDGGTSVPVLAEKTMSGVAMEVVEIGEVTTTTPEGD